MQLDSIPSVLAANRFGSYAGALLVILTARTVQLPAAARNLLTGLAIALMLTTYASELWVDADPATRRPGRLAVGVVGLAIGATLTLDGSLVAGLAFAAGGLFFARSGLVPRRTTER